MAAASMVAFVFGGYLKYGYETLFPLPSGMTQLKPTLSTPDSDPHDLPRQTVTLPADRAHSGPHERDKTRASVIAIRASAALAMQRSGCDIPTISFEPEQNTKREAVFATFNREHWTAFSNIFVGGVAYEAIGVSEDTNANNVAIGCSTFRSGAPAEFANTVLLRADEPYAMLQEIGVDNVM